MTALFQKECPSCGGTHAFCLGDERHFWQYETFEYVCPTSGQSARVLRDGECSILRRCPEGAVLARYVEPRDGPAPSSV